MQCQGKSVALTDDKAVNDVKLDAHLANVKFNEENWSKSPSWFLLNIGKWYIL